MTKFVIFSLPRSRSFWLSRWLAFGEAIVGHDLAMRCGGVEDFLDQFNQMDGTVETGAVLGWRVIRQRLPGVRLIALRRPLREVGASLVNLGVPFDHNDLLFKSIELDRLAQQPGVISFHYSEFQDEHACAKLFETCLGRPFSRAWYNQLAPINLQVDLTERLWYLQNHAARIAQFKSDIIDQAARIQTRGLN